MAKAAAAPKKALNKSQLLAAIAETSQLSKKEVGAVLDALGAEIKKSLSSKGAGAITLPGLIKIVKQHVPAKARARTFPIRSTKASSATIQPSRPLRRSKSAP